MELYKVIDDIKSDLDVQKLLGLKQNLVINKDKILRSKIPYLSSEYDKNLSGVSSFCWCGSGLHMKDCHFRYFTVKNPRIKLESHIKSFFDSVKICLNPDDKKCDKVIKAHSIHKGSMFSLLKDKKNHVYRINIKGEVVKEGYRNASTFYGMCKYHDEILFNKVFENNGFKGSQKEIFMTHYRAIVFELYRKLCLYKAYQDPFLYLECNSLDKEMRIHEKLLTINECLINKIEVLAFYSEYSKANNLYRREKWDDISSLSFYIKGNPIVGMTGMFIPYYNITRKNMVQKDKSRSVDKIAITSHVHSDDSFVIVFTFLKKSIAAYNYLKPILNLDKESQKTILFNALFEEIGNTYINKEWLDSLNEKDKTIINNMSKTLTNRNKPNNVIKSLEHVKWDILDIKNNF